MKLTIAHLYPDEMNIYGDRGNIITLAQRCQWRGIKTEVRHIGVGHKFNFMNADIIFGGGGQDRGQALIVTDLLRRERSIAQAVEDGVSALVICGTYQLFGYGFKTIEDQELPGIGMFAARTIGSTHRMIGNLVVESRFGRLVGFENHSGETVLEDRQSPLGKVVKGYGNNYTSNFEGALYKNAIGTYMHGPVLPKNPKLADFLIHSALRRRYGYNTKLKSLADKLEQEAAEIAAHRSQ